MTVYANPGTEGSIVNYEKRYENYIGGKWVPPVEGQYLENISPVTGEVFCEVARGTAADVELALDAAHAAADAWGKTSVAERALILHRIADRMEEHLEEIAGPVLSVATFSDFDEAIRIANDTNYGLGAGVWSRDQNTIYRAGRAIQAGRVWVNQYHNYPAHSAFGGYKESGIGRENHLMMLNHYQQTKNLLVSYDPNPTGLF